MYWGIIIIIIVIEEDLVTQVAMETKKRYVNNVPYSYLKNTGMDLYFLPESLDPTPIWDRL